jgi:hypothetical protein
VGSIVKTLAGVATGPHTLTYMENFISTKNNENVISLIDRPPKEKSEETEELSFEEVIKKNAENQKRMKEERAKANKRVVRTYRLKK